MLRLAASLAAEDEADLAAKGDTVLQVFHCKKELTLMRMRTTMTKR